MLWKLLLLSVFLEVHLTPMSKNEAMSYLKQYGYMIENSEEDFHLAMTKFQEFMGLTLTGEINDQTDKMMRMPRCGMPDIELGKPGRSEMYTLQGSRWKIKKITYKIKKYTSTLQKSIINRELQEAFDMWSYYLKIKFVPKVYGRSTINVGFYKYNQGGEPFDGPGNVLAYAVAPIFGGDIHFDDSENWTSQKETGINFKHVALHEIGHSLGLLHSSDADAIMYPTYRGYVKHLQLNEDDIMGLRKLYGRYMKLRF